MVEHNQPLGGNVGIVPAAYLRVLPGGNEAQIILASGAEGPTFRDKRGGYRAVARALMGGMLSHEEACALSEQVKNSGLPEEISLDILVLHIIEEDLDPEPKDTHFRDYVPGKLSLN